jgi:hypothetical protein
MPFASCLGIAPSFFGAGTQGGVRSGPYRVVLVRQYDLWRFLSEDFMRTQLLMAAAAALALLGTAMAAEASPTIQILSNSGTWRDTFYSSNTSTLLSVTDPYGTAPVVPVITQIAGGWKVTFAPSADFMAMADNATGGERQVFDGNLSFVINFGSPVHLSTSLMEDGIYRSTGNGTYSVTGGLIIAEADDAVPAETIHNTFPVATYDNGYWSLTDDLSGFTYAYASYQISLDNILEAWSLASQTAGSALVAKKDFSLIFYDGGGTTPEPATFGVLATGCLALLARRRRA